jgi:hypothetical protein
MSDYVTGESGEELIDEEGRNPTQERLDEEGVDDTPLDVDWDTAEDDD